MGSPPTLKPWKKKGLGLLLMGVGTVLLVLPGPGTPLILMGLFLLAGETAWMRRWRWRWMRWYVHHRRNSKKRGSR